MNKQLKSFVSAVWLYFFIISSVVAQWQEIPKPNGTPVYSLEYDGSRWFAGGGGLHARSFDAKAWQKITSIPGSGYFRMKKVGQRMYSSEQYEFWSDWLVNTIRFSEDGGDNWLDVSLPATITRAFFSGSRIFVQQENNNAAMFMSTNDGQTWQSVLTIPLGIGGSGSVYDLIGWNGELRCVSHEGVYASTNQGSSWNRIADCPEPPQAGDSVNVEGSARLFLFNQRLFLTGPFSNVHYSDNGGLQWHLIPSLQGVRDMVAHNGVLFATGPNAGLKRSDDNGLTWTTVAAPDDAGYALESDGSQLLLSGGSGIFRSPDAGVSWFSSHGLLQEGNGSPVWQMVQFDGKYILKQNKNIFETADQGQTWKFLFQAGQISRICVDGDACFIYPYFKTLGGSFQSVPLPVPISIDQYFTAAGDGKLFAYYLQTGEVWRSLNDGASWQNMGVSTSNYPYGISYYNGSLFVASYPDVLRSQNDGQTWQTAHQGLGNLDNSKYLYNAGNQLYLSLSSTVYRFDGTAWVLFYNNLSHIGAWNNRVFGYRSGLVVSADNGQTWNNIGGSNPGLDFNSLSIVDNKLCCSGFRLGGFDTQVIWTLDLNGFNAGVWSGRLFLDTNSNAQFDSGEQVLTGSVVNKYPTLGAAAANEAGIYMFTQWQAGDTLQLVSPSPNFIVFPQLRFPSNPSTNLFFCLQPTPSATDLGVELFAHSVFRPGFPTNLSMVVRNIGVSAQGGTLTLQLPGFLELLDAVPAVESNTGGLLSWTIPAIDPLNEFVLVLTVKTDLGASLGAAVALTANVQPDVSGDLNQGNNIDQVEDIVVGAYDPNDKLCKPSFISPASILAGEKLTYTIRFQNTGNYPASLVRILDTLPAQLNLSTLRVVGASHLMTWQLKQPRILEFVFENINLPDSISNEPGSHGFVEFEIQPNSDLPLGVTIKNRAAIYFDYNAPVITSYVTTPIATSSVSDEHAFEPLTIAPNPATTLAQIQLPQLLPATGTLRVWQADGKNVHSVQLPGGATQWSLDLSAWVPGVYWLEIQSEGLVKWTGKLIKQ